MPAVSSLPKRRSTSEHFGDCTEVFAADNQFESNVAFESLDKRKAKKRFQQLLIVNHFFRLLPPPLGVSSIKKNISETFLWCVSLQPTTQPTNQWSPGGFACSNSFPWIKIFAWLGFAAKTRTAKQQKSSKARARAM